VAWSVPFSSIGGFYFLWRLLVEEEERLFSRLFPLSGNITWGGLSPGWARKLL